MFKRLFSFFAIFATTLISCTPENENEPVGEKFEITSESIIKIGARGGNVEVKYVINSKVEGAMVEASSTAEWIKDITIGETITFSVPENKKTDSRNAIINITYDDVAAGIVVQQLGKDTDNTTTFLITSGQKANFESVACNGTITYNIVGEDPGTLPTAESSNSWITNINIESGKISFKLMENNEAEARVGKISVKYDYNIYDVEISQNAKSSTPLLVAERGIVEAGSSVNLKVYFENKDVTAAAKICDFNTKQEVANPYQASSEGHTVLYAIYNDLESNSAAINTLASGAPMVAEDANPNSYDFNYRMLLIDHTGTDCQYCPLMASALKDLGKDPEYNGCYNLAVAHSRTSSDNAYSPTARAISYYYQYTLGIMSGYPTLTFNYQFMEKSGNNIQTIKSYINRLKKEKQFAGIAAATAIDGNDLVVSMTLKSNLERQFKYNIFVLEDNIYSYQTNASQDWMHTHNDAIRFFYPELTNDDDITGGEWGNVKAGSTTSKTVRIPLNTKWVRENIKALVVISSPDGEYGNKFEVVNTVLCPVNGCAEFEYK